MKHKNLMARLTAGALALALVLSVGMTPAMATNGKPGPGNHHGATITPGGDGGGSSYDDIFAEPNGDSTPTPATNTVTVNDAVPGATYNLYKLLQLEHKDEEYTPEGATEKAKKIVTYRYSYGDGLKDIISKVVELPQFKYAAEAGGNAEITHPGYGFKVDGENVVFITPTTDDKGDYTEDETVKKLMVAFADELRKRIDDKTTLTPAGTQIAPDATGDATTSSVSFEKVPNGYWMITSNAGARSIIFTSPEEADVSKEVIVNEKNPAPTVDKKVLDVDDAAGDVTVENGVASWQDANDAQIGDDVDFKITVELFRGAENIVVHDEMTDGLTFKELKGVKFYPRNDEKNDDGTVTFDRKVYELGGTKETTGPLELTEVVDGSRILKADVANFVSTEHGFVLTFKNAFTNPAEGAANRDETDEKNNVFLGDLSTLEDDGGKVEILYSATLNENAVINGDKKLICTETSAEHTHSDPCYTNSNDNDAYVKYGHITGVNPGEDPKDPTEPPRESNHDETKTYTYRFSIDKYVDGDSATKLAGAEFELRQNFVKIGTAAVEGQNNAYVSGGKLVLPANEYVINDDPIALVDITPKDSTTGRVYRVATPEQVADTSVTTTTTIVTDDSGQITIEGLDSMLYSITETAAPKGYIKLDKPEMMAIGSVLSGNGGKVFIEDKGFKRAGDDADYSFNPNVDGTTKLDTAKVGIANASGIQMPRTGGIGTTIFYVLGGVMVVFAAGVGVVVIRKRRDGDAE